MRRRGPDCVSATALAVAVTHATPSVVTACCEACQWRTPVGAWTAGREDAHLPAAAAAVAAAENEMRIRLKV